MKLPLYLAAIARGAAAMPPPPQLQWMVVRNDPSFLRKGTSRGTAPNPIIRRSTTPSAMTDWITARHGAGGPQAKVPRASRSSDQTRKSQPPSTRTLKATLSSIWHMIHKNKYYPDLWTATIFTASAIFLSSQQAPSLLPEVHDGEEAPPHQELLNTPVPPK